MFLCVKKMKDFNGAVRVQKNIMFLIFHLSKYYFLLPLKQAFQFTKKKYFNNIQNNKQK